MQVNVTRHLVHTWTFKPCTFFSFFSDLRAQLESLSALSEDPSPTPSPSHIERASESAQAELER